MNTDPTLTEMREYLNGLFNDELDEFDREEAIYWFAANWHGGMSSNLYEAICSSQYKPGPLRDGPDSEMAKGAYDELEHYFTKKYAEAK
jgi:hypothetical protein